MRDSFNSPARRRKHVPWARAFVALAAASAIWWLGPEPVAGQTSPTQQTEPPATAVDTLPPITVKGAKPARAAKKVGPQQKRATSDTAAEADPQPQQPAETATGPVKDYVAGRSLSATKTDTPLQEIPQAISVVGAEQIRDQGAQALQEAIRYVPGCCARRIRLRQPRRLCARARHPGRLLP
ncbi:MAG: hypothetical protein HC869_11560 [Rhodospirillales bacterium]|nr:hypothetical protein [Rhodospirillales bacterium]